MPGQQGVELFLRLVGYPVADTLEHPVRVWARDETWVRAAPFGPIAVSPCRSRPPARHWPTQQWTSPSPRTATPICTSMHPVAALSHATVRWPGTGWPPGASETLVLPSP